MFSKLIQWCIYIYRHILFSRFFSCCLNFDVQIVPHLARGSLSRLAPVSVVHVPIILGCVMSLQSCLALCDPVDCSPPDCSVHGIFQARTLEWAAVSSSRGPSPPRGWTLHSQVCSVPLVPPGKPTIFEHFLLFLIPCSLFENTLFKKKRSFSSPMFGCPGSSLLPAGVSLWRLLVAEHGFSCRHVQAHLLCGLWTLPGPGIEPVSPAPGARSL